MRVCEFCSVATTDGPDLSSAYMFHVLMFHTRGFCIHLNMSYGFSMHAEVGDC